MLVAQDETEMAHTLEVLVRYVYFRGWILYPVKILRSATSRKILDIQG